LVQTEKCILVIVMFSVRTSYPRPRPRWVRIKDDGPTGRTTGQWGDPSSAVSSGPSFKMWLNDDGPDDGSVSVVKIMCLVLQTRWYSICYNITQSFFVPVFWDGQTEREEAMLWSYGCYFSCTKLSNLWFSCIGLYYNPYAHCQR